MTIPPRVWRTFYVVQTSNGRVFHVQKSDDGCTRTILVRR